MRPDTLHSVHWPLYRRGRTEAERVGTFEDLSLNLPLEASLAGMTLTFELPPNKPDPVYLKDRDGHILAEWEKAPSLTEIREVVSRYL